MNTSFIEEIRDKTGWRLRQAGWRTVEYFARPLIPKTFFPQEIPASIKSIFILRNNDLGDLLVITPLFEALRRKFPNAQIVAGVGPWSLEILRGNPYLSEVLEIHAPWFNKFIPQNGPWDALQYIYFSPEVRRLAERHFDVGIDVLGSVWGSLLMLQANIPFRLGVKGYAGGHTLVARYVEHNRYEPVGRAALRFAELLGATELPEARPQIFLSEEEIRRGEALWGEFSAETPGTHKRLVIGSGGGLKPKCWPLANYRDLVRELSKNKDLALAVVGGERDEEAGREMTAFSPNVRNFAGRLSLRETFALVSRADSVLCNPSMLMHVSAAFSKPTVVLLGEAFTSTRQHFAQWGFTGPCFHLGREVGEREMIYTPEEVLKFLRSKKGQDVRLFERGPD